MPDWTAAHRRAQRGAVLAPHPGLAYTPRSNLASTAPATSSARISSRGRSARLPNRRAQAPSTARLRSGPAARRNAAHRLGWTNPSRTPAEFRRRRVVVRGSGSEEWVAVGVPAQAAGAPERRRVHGLVLDRGPLWDVLGEAVASGRQRWRVVDPAREHRRDRDDRPPCPPRAGVGLRAHAASILADPPHRRVHHHPGSQPLRHPDRDELRPAMEPRVLRAAGGARQVNDPVAGVEVEHRVQEREVVRLGREHRLHGEVSRNRAPGVLELSSFHVSSVCESSSGAFGAVHGWSRGTVDSNWMILASSWAKSAASGAGSGGIRPLSGSACPDSRRSGRPSCTS